MPNSFVLAFAQTLVAAVYTLGTAAAAPQTLLLVANDDKLQFRCDSGDCTAEASTICLQYKRPSPARGTRYALVNEVRRDPGNDAGLTLVGRLPSGAEQTLPLSHLRILSDRGHRAVRFNVPKSVLAQYGFDSISLRVAHNIVLAPVPRADDPDPQREADIELALGPQRDIAERTLARRAERVIAAQIIRDTLNTLPRDRAASKQERKTAFARAVAKRRFQRDQRSESALGEVRNAFGHCGYARNSDTLFEGLYGRISSYRSCLNDRHDRLMMDINQQYWRDAEAGS